MSTQIGATIREYIVNPALNKANEISITNNVERRVVYSLFIENLKNISDLNEAESCYYNNLVRISQPYRDKALVALKKKRVVEGTRRLESRRIREAIQYVLPSNLSLIEQAQLNNSLGDELRCLRQLLCEEIVTHYQVFRGNAKLFLLISKKYPNQEQCLTNLFIRLNDLTARITPSRNRFKAYLKMAFMSCLINPKEMHSYFQQAASENLLPKEKFILLIKRIEKSRAKSHFLEREPLFGEWFIRARSILSGAERSTQFEVLQKVAVCQAEQEWADDVFASTDLRISDRNMQHTARSKVCRKAARYYNPERIQGVLNRLREQLPNVNDRARLEFAKTLIKVDPIENLKEVSELSAGITLPSVEKLKMQFRIVKEKYNKLRRLYHSCEIPTDKSWEIVVGLRRLRDEAYKEKGIGVLFKIFDLQAEISPEEIMETLSNISTQIGDTTDITAIRSLLKMAQMWLKNNNTRLVGRVETPTYDRATPVTFT